MQGKDSSSGRLMRSDRWRKQGPEIAAPYEGVAIAMKSIQHAPYAAGIGLRLPHIAEVVATRPQTGFLEIHPENFLANPHAAELLTELSKQYMISVHTVGISIGTAAGIDRLHLKRLRTFIEKLRPI